MKRNAFTLVELLVVVAIIGLLAAILLPSLSAAKAMARQAKCAANLHHIHTAFPAGQSDGAGSYRSLYPSIYEWPSGAQAAIGQAELFWCPDGPDEDGVEVAGNFAVYVPDEGPGGKYLEFEPTDALPWRLVFDRGDYWEYWFEDGKMFDIQGGVDYVFYVSKDPPRTAIFQDVPHETWRVSSITRGGKVLEGWEDLRTNKKGDYFNMDGGGTCNYGFNAALASRTSSAPETVLVLDYDRTIANQGEDMAAYLELAARHRGRLNVLHADGKVDVQTPIQLDPLLDATQWLPERPREP